jgi:hypothetical protein
VTSVGTHDFPAWLARRLHYSVGFTITLPSMANG